MSRDDRDYLEDIIHYGERLQVFAAGLSLADIAADDMRGAAMAHYLQIIGEAVSRLSPQVKARLPLGDVRGAIDMRNMIVHGYFRVDLPTIVETIQGDVPRLLHDVRCVLTDLDGTA